jgi:hypothetical protein
LGDLINVGFLVVKVNAGIEAMCLPFVAYLALTRLFSELSGAYAETPVTNKIHGNGRIWREWRPSAL